MSVGEFIGWLDGLVWGTVMMVLIIVVGILLSVKVFSCPLRLSSTLREGSASPSDTPLITKKAERETYPASVL